MASMIPNSFLYVMFLAYMSGKDIRARLVMTNTTCDTEIDAIDNLVDYSAIDVCDATSYADVALDTETIAVNDSTDTADFDTATDIVFSGLGGDATRDAQGVLLYQYVDGTDTNDIAIMFIDFTSDIPATATQVTVPTSTTLIATLAQG